MEDTRAAGVPPDVLPPHIPGTYRPLQETHAEPGRATLGQQETEQEDKGLLEKAIHKLTGQEEQEGSDRRGRR